MHKFVALYPRPIWARSALKAAALPVQIGRGFTATRINHGSRLILVDADGKRADFLVKKRKRDGVYVMLPRGRSRGFGGAHTDRARLSVYDRFLNFPGDAWRFFEGTLGRENFFAATAEHGLDFIGAFLKDFESTEDDQQALALWKKHLTEHKEGLADEHFEAYLFGEGVEVVAHDRWDTNDKQDFTKIAYVEFDDQDPESPSHRLSFHVRFNAAGGVEDVYALDLDGSGGDIGVRGSLMQSAALRGQ